MRAAMVASICGIGISPSWLRVAGSLRRMIPLFTLTFFLASEKPLLCFVPIGFETR